LTQSLIFCVVFHAESAGFLKYAYLEAELSAKPDETLEQTQARAKKIWHDKLLEEEAQERDLMRVIMGLPKRS
jgi:hypothetical protein